MHSRRTMKADEFKRKIEALAVDARSELERTKALHEELMRVRRTWIEDPRG